MFFLANRKVPNSLDSQSIKSFLIQKAKVQCKKYSLWGWNW
jgi:hypothetical protein